MASTYLGRLQMRAAIKAGIKDTRAEPFVRWLVKRTRSIRMPFNLVKNEIYDRQAAEVMSCTLSLDSNCIDIGCHRGQFLQDFQKYSPRGHHFAFEPIPELAQQLKTRFPEVEIFDLALTDRPGEASFYVVPEAPALSGLHRRDFVFRSGLRQEIKVPTEKLDSVIPSGMKIDFIKIDVEGAEGLVLTGALDAIIRNRPFIVLEHGARSSSDFGFTSEQIYEMLVQQCGLEVSLLAGWLKEKHSLTKLQFLNSREWYFLAHPPRG